MRAGRLIAVVGPSGVGKDSVMAGICAARPDIHRVRRVITRAPGLGGEDYDPVTEAEFEAMAREGAFAVHWRAHGLRYGLPVAVEDHLRQGIDCLANFSRRALAQAADRFAGLTVLNITAKPETLAHRLADRGREAASEIAKRLAEGDKPLPDGLDVIEISNDGALADTVAHALEQLQSVRA
jgi:ribose 1,5-bisphosphokinase